MMTSGAEGRGKAVARGKGAAAEGQDPTDPGRTEKIRPTVANAESYMLAVIPGKAGTSERYQTACAYAGCFSHFSAIYKEDETMAHAPIFRGAATALITPMTATGIDYEAFGKLIDWQIEQGINALVIAGTTGEASTLTDEEHKEVLRFAAERINHRVPMIAGTGSNDTAYAIELSKYACEVGADGLLIVTPYYNKATQKGLIAMFTAIADAVDKPLILYNVPSRTGVNIEPATYAALADHPMIAGIKEANGDIAKIVQAFSLVGDRLAIYSGNDDQITPILAMGGQGVISVLSNVAPKQTVEICDRFFNGDVAGSAALQCRLFPLIKSLFCEVNPIPVKAAMAEMGFCSEEIRLPLTPMDEAKKPEMLRLMREEGLL